MTLSPLARNGLLVLAAILTAAGALRFFASRADDQAVMRHTWDDTIAADDTTTWLLFLAERQVGAGTTWNWRMLPEEARPIWATVSFEMRLPVPPEPPDAESALPTYAETAAAYEAMDLADVARLVRAMRESRSGPALTAASTRLAALRPQILAGRKAYAEAHRAAIDRIVPAD